MLSTLNNETNEDQSSDIDDVEPKLTYDRLENDLLSIIQSDTISSSCLHQKFFAIGTHLGRIHIFDHQGNKVDRQEICVHLRAVNCISIDHKGEYLVSCSDDRLVVYGLCNSDHNFVMMPDNPVHVVAIDPIFFKSGSGRRFVAGDDRVVLYERGFLARYKSTVLLSGEGRIRTLTWNNQFIAWASDSTARIYDIEQRAVITFIKRDYDTDLNPSKTPCQFCWKDKRTLLIGWGNTVKVCSIKERPYDHSSDLQLKDLPKKYVEITSMFNTDFKICGLAPFDKCLLTLSMTSDDRKQPNIPGQMLNSLQVVEPRPQVQVIENHATDYIELSSDVLHPNGYNNSTNVATSIHLNKAQDYSFKLMSLHQDGVYFIVCPKDVISAKSRDDDDHIDWLIRHSKLAEASEAAEVCKGNLKRFTLKQVQKMYMLELLNKRQVPAYKEAAQLCAKICDTDQDGWDEAIRQFQELGQLKYLASHLPKDINKFILRHQNYDFVLKEFLNSDQVSFFKLIRELPRQVYSLQALTDQVTSKLNYDPKNLVLTEALAELYTRLEKFDSAVSIYLDSKDQSQVFSLIRNNNLVTILRDKVDRLMQIDSDETSRLLVENVDSIPTKDVINRLDKQNSQKYLVSYLHRMVQRDSDSCQEYHDLMVKLYAQYQPESLLRFLKLSNSYKLEDALEICQNGNLIKEVVFLLGRMGNLRVALQYITESLNDIHAAIEFCKEHQDKDLWHYLISYSMDKPDFIGALLKNIGTHVSDPLELIDKIPEGCEIEGLMPALVKILQDYQLQISLERGCRDLLESDCFSLLQKQIKCQSQGITINSDQVCDHCGQLLLLDESSTSKQMSSQANDVVVFGCHHIFHEECCSSMSNEDTMASHSCRVCMVNNDDQIFTSC